MKNGENQLQLPKVLSPDEWLLDRNELITKRLEKNLPKSYLGTSGSWLVRNC